MSSLDPSRFLRSLGARFPKLAALSTQGVFVDTATPLGGMLLASMIAMASAGHLDLKDAASVSGMVPQQTATFTAANAPEVMAPLPVDQESLDEMAWQRTLAATAALLRQVRQAGPTSGVTEEAQAPDVAAISPASTAAAVKSLAQRSAPVKVEDYAIVPEVIDAIADAAATVGVDFPYAMAVAARESSFRPDAENRASSAAGLFQFTDVSWMRAIDGFGAGHGYDREAGMIHELDDQRMAASSWDAREHVMRLRYDPHASAAMAAEGMRMDGRRLRALIGREPSWGELYLGHFLGITRARDMVRAVETDPGRLVTDVLPAHVVRANPKVFFETDEAGRRRPLSAAAVIDGLDTWFAAHRVHFAEMFPVRTAETQHLVQVAQAPPPPPPKPDLGA